MLGGAEDREEGRREEAAEEVERRDGSADDAGGAAAGLGRGSGAVSPPAITGPGGQRMRRSVLSVVRVERVTAPLLFMRSRTGSSGDGRAPSPPPKADSSDERLDTMVEEAEERDADQVKEQLRRQSHASHSSYASRFSAAFRQQSSSVVSLRAEVGPSLARAISSAREPPTWAQGRSDGTRPSRISTHASSSLSTTGRNSLGRRNSLGAMMMRSSSNVLQPISDERSAPEPESSWAARVRGF